jgi:hypothetical protein
VFNFFKKQENKEKEDKQEDEELSSVTYYVSSDGTIKIDMSMKDYTKESLDATVIIMNLIGGGSCFLQTLDFFKQAMTNENRTDLIAYLVMNIDPKVQESIINQTKADKTEAPYIKPSDLQR